MTDTAARVLLVPGVWLGCPCLGLATIIGEVASRA